ncbi:IMP cyclohydrolase, partial [Arthrospira platensis SPKY1]|nr:IMP cyclohydrolase [Arthrospira platensis SPKY1]
MIIYEAMLELPGVYLVTNGDQTRTIFDALRLGGTFEGALLTREREPDAPNYTPRISAMLDLRVKSPQIALNILQANQVNPNLTDHTTWRPALPPAGLGYCITTY